MNIVYSTMARHLGSSAVRDILKLTQGGNIISLAGGLPAEDLFPLEAVREAYNRALSGHTSVLQYGITEGYTPLREKVAARLSRQGIAVSPAEVVLTTGSQQSIDLLCRVLLDPGDTVLVESPTYLAALQVLGSYRANIVPVASDADGMLPDDLEDKLRLHKPKLLYAVPTFGNPTGATWSEGRRRSVVELCRSNGTLILEDNPYGEIAFAGGDKVGLPVLAAIDGAMGGGTVVYTGTFSKIVAPALRTGWVAGSRELVSTVARAKQAADLHSSAVDQRALDELLSGFDLEGHIAAISREYAARMKALSFELRSRNWKGAHWEEPQGGMFLWLTLDKSINTAELLPLAVARGVAFVPGEVFYPGEPDRSTMRLNFTHTPPQLLPLAVKRLEEALEEWSSKGLETLHPGSL
ncbi:2-aminoadipate transaminase [Paenibacillus sophorae]|uniref:2-aminoadipate transaminase n=1 Tax=Paenibacillus sophorae TaxID=1333845 RepID=A0A1H8R7X8_9BACL|nr:PLP-dependent aminotransferase family protein [Paenibacillus sophorae]QWU14973.1 PLP-dependent aminotransferase family protein [Paenibacillus sophorae]SEO62244.1 2-aminoadipate transaminase [Paenibacillus sophorae]